MNNFLIGFAVGIILTMWVSVDGPSDWNGPSGSPSGSPSVPFQSYIMATNIVVMNVTLTTTQITTIYNDAATSCLNDTTLVTLTITSNNKYTYVCSDGSSHKIDYPG